MTNEKKRSKIIKDTENDMNVSFYSEASDEELAALLKSPAEGHRRTAVLTELFSRYIAFMKDMASRMCGTPSDYEDLLHEGMRGFIQAVDCFDPERGKRFFPFMWSCVRNRMTDWLRRKSDPVDADSDEVGSVTQVSPEMSVVVREMIDDALSLLSPLEAKVLLMKYAGYSFEETGDRLSVSRKAAENAAARAQRKLRIYAR